MPKRGAAGGFIVPHSTRKRIARALAMLKGKKVEMTARKHDNLPVRQFNNFSKLTN